MLLNLIKGSELQDDLVSGLRGFFDEPSKKPLYKVFYGLHHSSVESWVSWIKAQDKNKQERAFGRLASYLEEAPKELGSISLEVVKAVILFDHQDSFDLLVTLLKNSRNKWAQYKALSLFYEPAAIGLINLNPKLGKLILLDELRKALDIPNSNHIKTYILNALDQIKDEQEKLKVFQSIIGDCHFDLEIRQQALHLIAQIGNEELINSLEQEIQRELKTNNEQELKFFPICLQKLFENINEATQEQTAWKLIRASCKTKLFIDISLQFIGEKLLDPNFLVEDHEIYDLIKILSNQDLSKLRPYLEQRFKLNEDEKKLIDEAESFQNLSEAVEIPDQAILLVDKVEKLQLPESFEKQQSRLKKIFTQKGNTGIVLLAGNHEDDKILNCQAIAQELDKQLIILNTEALLLSPDTIDELERVIHDKKPCIVFVNDCQAFLEQLISNDQRRIKKLSNTLKNFDIDPRVQVIYSLKQDLIDLEDQSTELTKFITDTNNGYFQTLINFDSFSGREKQKIYGEFELKLKPDREVEISDMREILNWLEDCSNTEYIKQLLNYIKSSLLSYGKLISIEEYPD